MFPPRPAGAARAKGNDTPLVLRSEHPSRRKGKGRLHAGARTILHRLLTQAESPPSESNAREGVGNPAATCWGVGGTKNEPPKAPKHRRGKKNTTLAGISVFRWLVRPVQRRRRSFALPPAGSPINPDPAVHRPGSRGSCGREFVAAQRRPISLAGKHPQFVQRRGIEAT